VGIFLTANLQAVLGWLEISGKFCVCGNQRLSQVMEKQGQTHFPLPVLMIIGVSLIEWAHSKAHGLGYIPIGSARHIIRKLDD
jgi:hypothetical protein